MEVQLRYGASQHRVQLSASAACFFIGMELDIGVRLDQTPNRRYNSQYGRWLSPDPAGTKAVTLTDPQTWNMYAYVRNNPTTLTDPSGLTATCVGNKVQCASDLQKLAPGTKVSADGTVSKASLSQRVLNHLNGNGAGTALVSRIVNNSHMTTITPDPGNPNGGTQQHGDVKYDPAGASIMTRGANGNLVEAHAGGTIILGHELIHQDHENRGLQDNSAADHIFTNGGASFSETVTREEFRTAGFSPFVMHGDITEGQLEKQLGQPVRATYTGPDNWVPVPQD